MLRKPCVVNFLRTRSWNRNLTGRFSGNSITAGNENIAFISAMVDLCVVGKLPDPEGDGFEMFLFISFILFIYLFFSTADKLCHYQSLLTA